MSYFNKQAKYGMTMGLPLFWQRFYLRKQILGSIHIKVPVRHYCFFQKPKLKKMTHPTLTYVFNIKVKDPLMDK